MYIASNIARAILKAIHAGVGFGSGTEITTAPKKVLTKFTVPLIYLHWYLFCTSVVLDYEVPQSVTQSHRQSANAYAWW